MASRHFRLYPGPDHQVLGLSLSLQGIECEREFVGLAAELGIRVTHQTERQSDTSWEELRIEPSLGGEEVERFGQALIDIALAHGYDGNANHVCFWDQSGEQPVLVARG